MNSSQRGKLLTYDPATGKGLITMLGGASAQKLAFAIEDWTSSEVPKIGMTLMVETVDGKISLAPVPDSELVKEKLGNLGQQLSGTFDKTVSSNGAAQIKQVGGNIVATIGAPVLAAYALFFVGTVFFNFANIKVMGTSGGASLYDLSALMAQAGGGSSSKLFIWLGFLSVLVPVFWKNPKAWLSYFMPLLAVLAALFTAWSAVSDMKKQMAELLGPNNLPGFSDFFSFGAGFYLAFIAAAALTYIGFMNFVKQK